MLLGVDVGGTFTDAALLDGDRLVTAKAPTTPADQSRGVADAVRAALAEVGADAASVTRFVHGMTVATNALLEGRTARTVLFATEGFTDLEELRRQNRADLYRLCAGHAEPIARLRVPVPERTGPDGVVLELDEEALRARIAELPDDCESAAVCLLWGFLHQEQERRVAELLAELRPDLHVSTSHRTAPVFREYERCATTVVDAAVSPLMRDYLRELSRRADGEGLPAPEVMLSSGGVADAEQAAGHGSWTVLSGPAGGAVGAAWIARAAGAENAVCLDMGGTSCDVSEALEGGAVIAGERQVGGRPLALPMVDVHTVGAGGGSVAWLDPGGALRVGPRSAGAVPGPAAYGRGGTEPTVTDANLVLGHLDPGAPLSDVRLDPRAARAAVAALAEDLGLSVEDCAAGIVRVANAEMVRALRVMTVERGIDPRRFALLAFGGAGPLHAAAIADELGMTKILVPRASGVLSALGLAAADRRADAQRTVLGHHGSDPPLDALRDEVGAALGGEPEIEVAWDLRYRGQSHELTVRGAQRHELRERFEALHEERYGHRDSDGEVELVTVRVTGRLPAPAVDFGAPSGEEVEGPTVVALPEATLVVPEGWSGRTDDTGTLVLERAS